jgi:hypothetical protein
MSLMDHIAELTDQIGPRGSATEAERKAAQAVAQQLADLGLQTGRQAFVSRTSPYSPLAVACGVALIGLFLFWQAQPVGAAAAAVITLFALSSAALEAAGRDNPLRWVVPTGYSEHILAPINARRGEPVQSLLISAALDSPRSRRPARMLPPLIVVALAALLILAVIGIGTDARLLRQIALLPGVVILIAFALLLLAARSPVTPGANDNASGVALALALAERLAGQPLERRDVVIAFTGCGQVGGAGLEALLVRGDPPLRPHVHVVAAAVGGQAGHDLGPAIVSHDAALLAAARSVTAQGADLGAVVATPAEMPAELNVSARHGLRAIAVTCLGGDGSPPNAHLMTDTTANINEATLERSTEFAWRLLHALDAEDRA